MLSDRRVLYSRDYPRGPRTCDTDGALEDWNSCVTGVPLCVGIRGLCVAKSSSDRVIAGPADVICAAGSHRWEAYAGGSVP